MAKPKLALIFNISMVAVELLGRKKHFKYKNNPSLFAENVYENIKYEDIIKGYPQFLPSDRILTGASPSRH